MRTNRNLIAWALAKQAFEQDPHDREVFDAVIDALRKYDRELDALQRECDEAREALCHTDEARLRAEAALNALTDALRSAVGPGGDARYVVVCIEGVEGGEPEKAIDA